MVQQAEVENEIGTGTGGTLGSKEAMATIAVKDLKVARAFYVGKLGMKPEPKFLKAGDVVTLGIDGLGEQRQKVAKFKR